MQKCLSACYEAQAVARKTNNPQGGVAGQVWSPRPCDRAGSPDFSPRTEKRSSAAQWFPAAAIVQAARSRKDAGDGGHRCAPARHRTNAETRRAAPSLRTRKNAPNPGEKRPEQGMLHQVSNNLALALAKTRGTLRR